MSAQSGCKIAHPGRRAACGIALLVCLSLAGGGRSQGGAPPAGNPSDGTAIALPGALESRIAELIDHADPVVRGEAALALAATGDERHYDAILGVARDRQAPASTRGILAVGYLGAPGSEAFLGEVLEDAGRRDSAASLAAFALGLLPESHTAPAIDAYLRKIQGASYRQHRETLAALLLGLSQTAHPSRVAVVRALLEDASNRDPRLREAALEVLSHVPDSLPREHAEALLKASSEIDRLAAMTAIRAGLIEPDAALLQTAERLARRDNAPRVRAAALGLLTDRRHLAALDIAPRALRSRHPEEAAAGVATALRLGGGALRIAVEQHILAARRPETQARMLAACGSSRSPRFLDACVRLAGDRRADRAVRIAATTLLARSADARSAPAARDLFLQGESYGELLSLGAALVRVGALESVITAVVPPKTATDARLLPLRLRALLALGHPRALDLLDSAMRASPKDARRQAELLRALRLAALPSVPTARVERLGDSPLADLLH